MTAKRYRELMGQCDALIGICKAISETPEPSQVDTVDAAGEAAMAVPVDQIDDAIKWTESYLETLKVRTLVSRQNEASPSVGANEKAKS